MMSLKYKYLFFLLFLKAFSSRSNYFDRLYDFHIFFFFKRIFFVKVCKRKFGQSQCGLLKNSMKWFFPRFLPVAERTWHEALWEKTEDKVERIHKTNEEWTSFSAALTKVLMRLNKMGIMYRLPSPGATHEWYIIAYKFIIERYLQNV